MMAQWQECKKKAEDSILFFRMGDFYEAFYDDAALVAKELDLTLTSRQEIPMSGVPAHTCETYIDRPVSKGYRVAVAEQMEDPKKTKGLVKRDVVRVVTPGTVISSGLLSDKTNNYIASLARVNALLGLAILDLTTSDFRVIEFDQEQDLLNEIHRFRPAEFVVAKKLKGKLPTLFDELSKSYNPLVSEIDDWRYEHQVTYASLVNHFNVHTLDGFGLRGMTASINAAGALIQYLQENLNLPISHIREIQTYTASEFMVLDRATQRNLELTESLNDGSRRNTLLSILDKTNTPMGARLLRHWIKQPLLNPVDITRRQEAIEVFYTHLPCLEQLIPLLGQVRDLERLMVRISSGYATPRDMVSLRFSLAPLPAIKNLLQPLLNSSQLLHQETEKITPLPELVHLISNALVDEPPVRLSEGGIFRPGYSQELDEYREISHNGKAWLARYQALLREQTNIKTIKVGYNKMFGYYIEVSKGQSDRMPANFERRQTLVNAERYITPELKEYEDKVTNAEERSAQIEQELFTALRLEVAKHADSVKKTALALAKVDALRSLAESAHQYHYVRPIVDESSLLQIIDGRHPVIEAAEQIEKFVPNDTLLDDASSRLMLITGPNMAGKSTYIRQVALITLMAQIGSFVPAKSAHIGIIDKIFTRIGASDDLARGQSTFMVEMTETANILNNATERSLVILDEIGRGTSTYDGISIAWSVAEYLLTTPERAAKTLFATHYWELTKLEEKVPGAINYNVAVNERDDEIVFLRKIVRGGTDKSYGIYVGRLAGLPQPVIARAREILVQLEENANRKSAFEPPKLKKIPRIKQLPNSMQLTFFS
jgi:DNA mismatch repair protein MutS